MSVAKAIAAGVAAILGGLLVGYEDDALSTYELLVSVNAGVGAFVATYFIPNAAGRPVH